MPNRPAAVTWYMAYSWVAGIIHIVAAALATWAGGQAFRWFQDDSLAFSVQLTCWTFVPVLFFFGLAYPALAARHSIKRAWEVHFVSIALGVGSGIFTLPCIPLMIAWFNPEVKAYFKAQQEGR